jgi:hypothetical protein
MGSLLHDRGLRARDTGRVVGWAPAAAAGPEVADAESYGRWTDADRALASARSLRRVPAIGVDGPRTVATIQVKVSYLGTARNAIYGMAASVAAPLWHTKMRSIRTPLLLERSGRQARKGT